MLVFVLTRMSGDILEMMLPIEATAEDFARTAEVWGLDKNIVEQYFVYMNKVIHGDWGRSLDSK